MTTIVINRDIPATGLGANLLSRTLGKIGAMFFRRRIHTAPEKLDDRLLRDIGLTHFDLEGMLVNRR